MPYRRKGNQIVDENNPGRVVAVKARVKLFNEIIQRPDVLDSLRAAGTNRGERWQTMEELFDQLDRRHPLPEPLNPKLDPDIPHPGMVFFWGQWRSPQAIEKQKNRIQGRGRPKKCDHPQTPEYMVMRADNGYMRCKVCQRDRSRDKRQRDAVARAGGTKPQRMIAAEAGDRQPLPPVLPNEGGTDE
jgi:hypothetical protein